MRKKDKKNYVKLDAGLITVTPGGPERLSIEIKGRNLNNSEVIVTANVDLYDIVNAVQDARKIIAARLDQAKRNLDYINNCLNEKQ